jgi:hypothetical protein
VLADEAGHLAGDELREGAADHVAKLEVSSGVRSFRAR